MVRFQGEQQAPEPVDNLQALLQRRAEQKKTKAKYTLTETDATLLTTHSNELFFADGQTIVEERQDIASLYRVKSGKVTVYRNGFRFEDLSKGWFIGDMLVLYDTTHHIMRAQMKANGPVVLQELNINFVKQLFKIDVVLSVKFLRHLATKYAHTFINILSNLQHPSVQVPGTSGSSWWSSELSNVDVSSIDINPSSSSSTDSDPSQGSNDSDNTISSPSPSAAPQQRGKPRREHAYKVYPLAHTGSGIQFMSLKSKHIKVVTKSFGFSFKTRIEINKISTVSKVGETGLTIIYQPRKVSNVFFKNYYDREEFTGLINSIVTAAPPSPSIGRPSGAITVPHNPNLGYDEVPLCGGQEKFYQTIQSHMRLKKGERVFAEGDLFQRVFTLVKGQCHIIQNGRIVSTMESGEIFGEASLVYMRPANVTIEVATDTADLFYIPAYRINGLIDTDVAQAQRLYLHAAQSLERKIGKILGYMPKKRVGEKNGASEGADENEKAVANSSICPGWANLVSSSEN